LRGSIADSGLGPIDDDGVAGEMIRQLTTIGGLRPGGREGLVLNLRDLGDVGFGHGTNLIAGQCYHAHSPAVTSTLT